MIFDTHAHYDDKSFNEDRHSLLSSMREENVGRIVNVGCDLRSSKRSVELAQKYIDVYAAVGYHPSDVQGVDMEEAFAEMRKLLKNPKSVAVGEIGLDYHWMKDPKGQKIQKTWFKKQLSLAKELRKPIIIHSREASADTMDVLRKYYDPGASPLVMHCYSYGWEEAKVLLEEGCYLGIGGTITYKGSDSVVETVKKAPMENILLETDCPYLSPVPNRGKRNDSSNIRYVVEEISKIKGISPSEVEDITWKNAQRFYRVGGSR